jgi:hypothetical protein
MPEPVGHDLIGLADVEAADAPYDGGRATE